MTPQIAVDAIYTDKHISPPVNGQEAIKRNVPGRGSQGIHQGRRQQKLKLNRWSKEDSGLQFSRQQQQ